VRFWDTSALIPLLLEQGATASVEALLDDDAGMAAWWGTPVECASAFARLRREGALSQAEEAGLSRLFDRVRAGWYEMLPGDQVRRQALRVLRLHALRAACVCGRLTVIKWLWGLDKPDGLTLEDVRAKNNDALLTACLGGYLEVAQWLWGLGLTRRDVRALAKNFRVRDAAVLQWLKGLGA